MSYDFENETADCESAEDFLAHFDIACERAVVQVNRLHILQRFHDYIASGKPEAFDDYRALLERAYGDFVASDALTERVFSVHRRAAGIATVPLTAISRKAAA